MKKLLMMSLIGGLVWGFSIENGGDRGILVASVRNNPESAADMLGDLICWWQPDTQTATSNIVVTEVLETATTKIKVLPEKTYVKNAGTFTVDIWVEDVSGLDVADLYLLFNPVKIALIGIPTQGTIFTGNNMVFLVDASGSSSGYIRISGGRMDSPFTGTGTLAEKAIFKSLVNDPTSSIDIGTGTLEGVEVGKIPFTSYLAYIYPYSLGHFDLLHPVNVIAGRPWTTTITAKDQSNQTLLDYNGTITITSNLGTITYQLSKFTNGVAVATITRYQIGTMSITVLDNQVGISKQSGIVTIRYLCDFGKATNDTNPDGNIGVIDLLLFIQYWRTPNPNGDIGGQNQTGNAPYIISQPDGTVDIWDLMIFIKMWRWSNGIKAMAIEAQNIPKLAISPSRIEAVMNEKFFVDVRIEDGNSLVGCGVKMRYDPNKLEVVSVNSGGYFGEGFKEERSPGLITLNDFTSKISDGISGSGVIAKIEFKGLSEEMETKIEIEKILSSILNIEPKMIEYTINNCNVENAGPSYSALFQSVPNPARDSVWIPFQLAEGGETKIVIYNILGQVVRNLDLGYKTKRYYKTLAEGSAFRWDLKNSSGQRVANGLYFYKLSSGKFSDCKALAITK